MSLDPMLLYRFDSRNEYPVLRSYTTVRGEVHTLVEGSGVDTRLRVLVDPEGTQPQGAVVVLALPSVAFDGTPERFELAVDGDGSGSRIMLEASDARAGSFMYVLGDVDFEGVRTCCAEVLKHDDPRIGRASSAAGSATPPIELLRLAIGLDASCRGVALGLISLAVTGRVRLVPHGLADSP
ncbi:MAG: hypothetical protein ACE5HE_08930 [Phycisphaerae bacterium]